MEESKWYARVEEILAEKGLAVDTTNDGWDFLFSNGNSPENAVNEMING